MALKMPDLGKIPAKQKAFLAILICLLAGGGYYQLSYRKAAAEIRTLETKLAEMGSKIKEQEVIARNLPSFQAEVKRLEGDLALLLDQLPNSAEIPNLLKSVTDLGRNSGLEFVKFSPRQEVRKDFFAEIPVSITVAGGYHGFVMFADRVSHLPRIVNLSDITFGKPRASGDKGVNLSITCSATTYRFIEQAAAPPPPPAGKKGTK